MNRKPGFAVLRIKWRSLETFWTGKFRRISWNGNCNEWENCLGRVGFVCIAMCWNFVNILSASRCRSRWNHKIVMTRNKKFQIFGKKLSSSTHNPTCTEKPWQRITNFKFLVSRTSLDNLIKRTTWSSNETFNFTIWFSSTANYDRVVTSSALEAGCEGKFPFGDGNN